MTRTLTIDPGGRKKGSAVAEWLDGTLAGVTHGVTAGDRCPMVVDVVVVERPEPQGDRSTIANVGDIIDLAWEAGAVAYGFARVPRVIARTPSSWKGSQRKPQQHARAWRLLTEDERRVLPPETGAVIDAACEAGARERWKKGGSAYYPRTKKVGALPDILDAVALGLVHFGRLL